jgi:GNAT superfamily N-acetyltransferase
VSAEPVLGPEPLDASHEIGEFDCGVVSLNSYLAQRAFDDQRAGKSRTYVITVGTTIAGCFSLAAGAVEPEQATSRLAKGQGNQPIPVVLLARLAVDSEWQGRGFGESLLVEALARSVAAAEVIGARAVLVHAVDQRSRSFYLKYGFEPSPTDQLHLVMLMKDIRKTLG